MRPHARHKGAGAVVVQVDHVGRVEPVVQKVHLKGSRKLLDVIREPANGGGHLGAVGNVTGRGGLGQQSPAVLSGLRTKVIGSCRVGGGVADIQFQNCAYLDRHAERRSM